MKEGKTKMERPHKVTAAQLAQALEAASGIMARAARIIEREYKTPFSRQAVRQRVLASPELQRVRDAARENILDECEDVLFAEIEGGHWRVALEVLKLAGKDRGYIPRQEIAVNASWNLEALTKEELETLEALCVKASGGTD